MRNGACLSPVSAVAPLDCRSEIRKKPSNEVRCLLSDGVPIGIEQPQQVLQEGPHAAVIAHGVLGFHEVAPGPFVVAVDQLCGASGGPSLIRSSASRQCLARAWARSMTDGGMSCSRWRSTGTEPPSAAAAQNLTKNPMVACLRARRRRPHGTSRAATATGRSPRTTSPPRSRATFRPCSASCRSLPHAQSGPLPHGRPSRRGLHRLPTVGASR